MARNVIQSEFWTSKMADGSHFCQKSKKNKVAYRSEMARNEIKSDFQTSKMPARKKILYRSEMARIVI